MLAFTAPPPRPTVSPFFSLSHFPPQLSSAFETDANANARPRLVRSLRATAFSPPLTGPSHRSVRSASGLQNPLADPFRTHNALSVQREAGRDSVRAPKSGRRKASRESLPWAPPRPACALPAASSAESAASFLDVVEEEMGDNSDDNPFKMDIDIDSPVCIAPSELLPPPSPRPRARHAPILDAPRFSFPSTPFALLPSTTLPPISTKLPSISESDEDSEEDIDEDADEAAWLPTFVHLPALRRPYTRKHVGPWRKARKEDSLEWLRLATLSRCHQAGTLPGEAYGAIEVDMEL